jgi:hypothetical protein
MGLLLSDYKKFKYALYFKTIQLQAAEIQVPFIQLKPILYIFLCGFSLSSCPQHSLRVVFPLKRKRLLEYVTNFEHNSSYFDPD